MYRIIVGGNTVYSDAVTFIRLAENGSYTSCSETEAEGVCAKIARDKTDENGESITQIADEVYRVSENGLNKVEPLATVTFAEGTAPLTVNQTRQAALERISGKCSAAIYSGVTVNGKHYTLSKNEQDALAIAQTKVDKGATSVIYGDGLTDAATITAISAAAYEWGVVCTTYYAYLKQYIAAETDVDKLAAIDFGKALPDSYMQQLTTLLSSAGIDITKYSAMFS